MSSTELSREIASLVSRALGGETIDPAAAGASLARRYPHLFLTGDLIAKAVARAAAMVGVVLTGSEAALAPPAYRPSAAAFWYIDQGPAAAATGPDINARGWFAPPRSGRGSVALSGQMLLATDGPESRTEWASIPAMARRSGVAAL